MKTFFRFILFMLVVLCISNVTYSQTYQIKGKVKNQETEDAVPGAKVTLTPGTNKTTTDSNGDYVFTNISAGKYIVKTSYIGYEILTAEVTVSNSDVTVNFDLKSGTIQTDELIIEINRAKLRETPVAFTTVGAKTLDKIMSGQDAPLLVKGVPGLYSYSTDGVGNGEGQLLVRGFSQNYVQVLINGVPTNDPESNAVYWSNWGSVSSNAGSIQIQRGAGSSLYGSGSFGGSFNVITENPDIKHFYGLNLSLGDPMNTVYGIKINSGLLLKNKLSIAFNVSRKIAEGSRVSGRYEGINYYTSISFFPNSKQSVKLVLHGAPQEHGYSYSNHVAYFEKFGFKANSAPFLPKSVVEQLPPNKTTGEANYGLLDGKRELDDKNFINLSHNFFHKPQLELHYSFDVNKSSRLLATLFYSMGRGAGSSINSSGTMFRLNKGMGIGGVTVDTLVTNYYNSEGYINDTSAANKYLQNAYQRISYSLHDQFGTLASYQTQISKNLNITGGAEFRYWTALHPGYFTNLFGKSTITQRYAFKDSVGAVKTFNRTVYQGDIDGPESDNAPFGWNLADDPTYRTEYRNYKGQVPQLTVFAQGNYVIDKFNLMGSLQYVWYQYKLTENMPSENAIGKRLDINTSITQEGPAGDKFYMKGTDDRMYEFDLVKADRSRGFLQPKFGINYNATKNLNVFGNFAHVERFIDLGVYYNYGLINPDAEDEKSNQFEAGLGWTSDWINFKLNGYYMLWDNKVASIQDISKAGEPGYDRNGYRYELIGSSEHRGLEFEFNTKFDKFISIKGLGFKGSVTFMDNVWKKVFDNVKTVDSSGVQVKRVFNNSAYDENGNTYRQYFDELEGKHVASGPQFILNLGLNYDYKGFFAGVDMNLLNRFYLLDGDTYLPTKSELQGTNANGKELWRTEYNDQLPPSATFDAYIGYSFALKNLVKGSASVQVFNIADTDYFSAADRYGLIPGAKRTLRFNFSLGY